MARHTRIHIQLLFCCCFDFTTAYVCFYVVANLSPFLSLIELHQQSVQNCCNYDFSFPPSGLSVFRFYALFVFVATPTSELTIALGIDAVWFPKRS